MKREETVPRLPTALILSGVITASLDLPFPVHRNDASPLITADRDFQQKSPYQRLHSCETITFLARS